MNTGGHPCLGGLLAVVKIFDKYAQKAYNSLYMKKIITWDPKKNEILKNDITR